MNRNVNQDYTTKTQRLEELASLNQASESNGPRPVIGDIMMNALGPVPSYVEYKESINDVAADRAAAAQKVIPVDDRTSLKTTTHPSVSADTLTSSKIQRVTVDEYDVEADDFKTGFNPNNTVWGFIKTSFFLGGGDASDLLRFTCLGGMAAWDGYATYSHATKTNEAYTSLRSMKNRLKTYTSKPPEVCRR